MNTSYSLDSDSPRWWWPQAAVGALGAAAIAGILVLPTAGIALPGETRREAPPAPDPWFSTIDPELGRPCFLTRARWNVALDQPQPRCGHPTANGEPWTGMLRPGLSFSP